MSCSAAARPISCRKRLAGSKRKDDKDYIKLFQDAGYTLATDKTELATAAGTNTGKILGLFHTGNMDVTLDREFLKKGTVDKFPNQPGLVEMTKVALDELSKNPDGFFLMVEGAIDRQDVPSARLGPRALSKRSSSTRRSASPANSRKTIRTR